VSSLEKISGGNVLGSSVIQSGLIMSVGESLKRFVDEVVNGFASLGNGCLFCYEAPIFLDVWLWASHGFQLKNVY